TRTSGPPTPSPGERGNRDAATAGGHGGGAPGFGWISLSSAHQILHRGSAAVSFAAPSSVTAVRVRSGSRRAAIGLSASSPASVTLLYLTWGRENAPDTEAELTKAYRDLAKETKAMIAPVGVAWEAVLKDDPKAGLHAADKSHPTRKGTYLAACVFYGCCSGRA